VPESDPRLRPRAAEVFVEEPGGEDVGPAEREPTSSGQPATRRQFRDLASDAFVLREIDAMWRTRVSCRRTRRTANTQ